MAERTSRVRCITAPNPSPMMLDGTNSYLILGSGEAFAIDPGPASVSHVEKLVAIAAQNECRIAAIAVTHGHPDHFPGAALLRELTNAPVYAHPAATFPFTRAVSDDTDIAVHGAVLRVLYAPGHASDHLVLWFAPERALFTGDVVIGRGTVVIAPPDGDMRAYQATLRRLRDIFPAAKTIFGGHGGPVESPHIKIDEYIAHRELRERQIIAALEACERTIPEIVALLYSDLDSALRPAAARQVLAYLIALEREGRVRVRAILEPDLSRIADAANVERVSVDAYSLSEA